MIHARDTFTAPDWSKLVTHAADQGGTWKNHPAYGSSSTDIIRVWIYANRALFRNYGAMYLDVTPPSADYYVEADYRIVSDIAHNVGDILTITLLLHEQVLFKVQAEVLRREPLPHRAQASRIHAHFIQISEQERELLIRHIMRLQREHLHGHYSA